MGRLAEKYASMSSIDRNRDLYQLFRGLPKRTTVYGLGVEATGSTQLMVVKDHLEYQSEQLKESTLRGVKRLLPYSALVPSGTAYTEERFRKWLKDGISIPTNAPFPAEYDTYKTLLGWEEDDTPGIFGKPDATTLDEKLFVDFAKPYLDRIGVSVMCGRKAQPIRMVTPEHRLNVLVKERAIREILAVEDRIFNWRREIMEKTGKAPVFPPDIIPEQEKVLRGFFGSHN